MARHLLADARENTVAHGRAHRGAAFNESPTARALSVREAVMIAAQGRSNDCGADAGQALQGEQRGGWTSESKAPAYQWYVRDWMSDEAVRLMTYEQRGILRELLDHQWLERSIPADVKQLARLLGMPAAKFQRVWPPIAEKFVDIGGGRLQNERLERSRTRLQEFRENKRQAGLKSAEVRREKFGSAQPHNSLTVLLGEADRRTEQCVRTASEQAVRTATKPAVCDLQSANQERHTSYEIVRAAAAGVAGGAQSRGHIRHAFCGRMCVPDFLEDEFRRSIGGPAATVNARLETFYQATLASIPDEQPIGEEPVHFWRQAFARQFGPRRATRELRSARGRVSDIWIRLRTRVRQLVERNAFPPFVMSTALLEDSDEKIVVSATRDQIAWIERHWTEAITKAVSELRPGAHIEFRELDLQRSLAESQG
jgi:uncharacterized protein YdaU (DUF1376 family)